MKTELIQEGKYDEYGNRRTVDIASRAMPLQEIEIIYIGPPFDVDADFGKKRQ